ncbi:MAG TPA: hypothetical protein PLM24_09880 [Methanothrix sp.]|nr:hypothetical protein [Methanothrix sp.]HPJ85272.1 hypothetical protein [Methanothrix sp.]HPR67429.1 hypothetical protein [Methanothrix sp.]
MTKSGKVHKYICRNCGRVFCGRTNTAFYDLRTEDGGFQELQSTAKR